MHLGEVGVLARKYTSIKPKKGVDYIRAQEYIGEKSQDFAAVW